MTFIYKFMTIVSCVVNAFSLPYKGEFSLDSIFVIRFESVFSWSYFVVCPEHVIIVAYCLDFHSGALCNENNDPTKISHYTV